MRKFENFCTKQLQLKSQSTIFGIRKNGQITHTRCLHSQATDKNI